MINNMDYVLPNLTYIPLYRINLLRNSVQRMTSDGLNTLKYKVEKVDEEPLITFVRIQLKKSMYT